MSLMNDELYSQSIITEMRLLEEQGANNINWNWWLGWVRQCCLAILRCCNQGRFQHQMNLQKDSASPGSRLRDITLSALNVSRASRKSQRWIETKFKLIVSVLWWYQQQQEQHATPRCPPGLCGVITGRNELGGGVQSDVSPRLPRFLNKLHITQRNYK